MPLSRVPIADATLQQQQQQQQMSIRKAALRSMPNPPQLSIESTGPVVPVERTYTPSISSNNSGHSGPMAGQNNNHFSAPPAMLPATALTLYDVLAEDPLGGMNNSPSLSPATESPPAPQDPFFRCFWLMRLLEQTMVSGGFLTKKLFVPRQIWYQKLVRLPAWDFKITACQTMATLLERMTAQAKKGMLILLVEPGGGAEGDQNRAVLLKELEAIETTALQLWVKTSKKLSFIHRPGKHPGTGPVGPSVIGGMSGVPPQQQQQQQQQQHQQYGSLDEGGDWSGSGSTATGSHDPLDQDEPLLSSHGTSGTSFSLSSSLFGSATDLKSQWKNFSKTVQKSIGNDKCEDISAYTESVIQLFQASYVLESMLRHYSLLAPYQTHIQIVNRLRRLCEFLNMVVCAFVVRDLSELMSKYAKRVGAWVVSDLNDK
ncbi:hypothetical protein BGZ75_007918 [Mortierella antarctica]|nr:hypothetical protein BGZ75_007918 [Mortierella antarctica]